MRILEYSEFNSEEFPKIVDIQACFYDITEDENIRPIDIFKGSHANVTFIGSGFGKRKILDFKEELNNSNKSYNAFRLCEYFEKNSIKLNNTTSESELKECDYQFFHIELRFKKLPKFDPSFSKFSSLMGDGDKFNQDYGKGEDIYKKAKRMFREYDDYKNKDLFDIIDILEGCIGRVEDLCPKWKPINYLVGNDDGEVHYQGYFVNGASNEEYPLWWMIFRKKIVNKKGYKIIDGILD